MTPIPSAVVQAALQYVRTIDEVEQGMEDVRMKYMSQQITATQRNKLVNWWDDRRKQAHEQYLKALGQAGFVIPWRRDSTVLAKLIKMGVRDTDRLPSGIEVHVRGESMQVSTGFKRALEAELRRLMQARRPEAGQFIRTTRAVPLHGGSNRQAKRAAFELALKLGRQRAQVRNKLVVFLQPVELSRVRSLLQDIEMAYNVRFEHTFGSPSTSDAVKLPSASKDTVTLIYAADYGLPRRRVRIFRNR